jgi:hypothetical protein
MSPIPTVPDDQVGPFCPSDHEHVQAVLIVHVQFIFSDLAVLDTVVGDPCLEQSTGSRVTHDNKI